MDNKIVEKPLNDTLKLNEEENNKNDDGKIKILDDDDSIKLDILDLNSEIDKLPNAISSISEKKELNIDNDILNLSEISLDSI